MDTTDDDDEPTVLDDDVLSGAHDVVVKGGLITKRAPVAKACGSMNGAKKRGGRPCGNSAGKRTEHVGWGCCWLHGGNSPSGVAAAERERVAHEQAVLEATAKRYMVPVDMDPRDGLLEEVARSAGWLRYWDRRVNDLEPEELAGVLKAGRKSGSTAEGYVDVTTWAAGNHVVVTTWERARRDFVRVCKDAAQAGVEERRVKLAEEQGALMAQVVEAIVTGLGRSLDDPEVEPVVRRAMSDAMAGTRHLSVVAG